MYKNTCAKTIMDRSVVQLEAFSLFFKNLPNLILTQ